MCDSVRQQRICVFFTKRVITNGANSCIVYYLNKLTEMVVCIATGSISIAIRCTQQQASGCFIAMSLNIVASISLGEQAIETIISFQNATAIAVGFM